MSYELTCTTLDRETDFPLFVGIVDDESDIANLFRDALDCIPGVKAFGFSDPLLALEHFRHNYRNYRCMISDYRMPELNGIELLDKVREIDASVTRVLMSAFEIEDQVFGNCQCIDKFLQKPVWIKDLIALVQESLEAMKVQKRIE